MGGTCTEEGNGPAEEMVVTAHDAAGLAGKKTLLLVHRLLEHWLLWWLLLK